jgi:phosphatidylserine decarboxylase
VAPAIVPDDASPIIAREGWPIVAVFAIVSILLSAGAFRWFGPAGLAGAGAVCGALTLWCVWFFRDPPRRIPGEPGLVISPADGVVVSIGPAAPPAELAMGAEGGGEVMTRVCVFMNVFNVHVNRMPVAGTIVGVHYRPGKFFNASLDKASEHNERSSLTVRTSSGHVLAVVQIAGLVARRIISRVHAGDSLRVGQRYGLIRFGSRVDVYVPAGSVVAATLGQTTIAGETVIARLPSGRESTPDQRRDGVRA